jgi:hypothetical protein
MGATTILRGTGRLSTAIREVQIQTRQLTARRVAGARVSVHPLGTTVEPDGTSTVTRRAASPSIPRYG